MLIKYVVNTPMMDDAVKMAKSMASMNGFKTSQLMSVKRLAGTEWEVNLLAHR